MRPAFALIVSILLTGCASSARINQFQAFAQLGHRHQVALGGVIDQAVASNIDANSQELLDIREQKVPAKRWGPDMSGDEILDANNLAVIETTRPLMRSPTLYLSSTPSTGRPRAASGRARCAPSRDRS